jgi:hypothetical protein
MTEVESISDCDRKICYRCGNPVTLRDLIRVDYGFLALKDKVQQEYAGYVAHCAGPDTYFHDNEEIAVLGIPNLCPECHAYLLAIFDK